MFLTGDNSGNVEVECTWDIITIDNMMDIIVDRFDHSSLTQVTVSLV